MPGPLHDLVPSPGWLASERSPETTDLYVTPAQLESLYGLCVTEGEIRAAMALIAAYTNRPSLWPEIFEERIEIPDDRNTAILAGRPVHKLLHAAGRYGGGRRDQRTLMQLNFDYLAALAVLGSAPRWQEINVDDIEFYPPTGEVWLPMGYFPIRYAQLQIRYVTGLTQIPDRVKMAVADIINTIRTRGVSDRRTYTVGRVSMQFSGTGFVSDTAGMLLEPFIVHALM